MFKQHINLSILPRVRIGICIGIHARIPVSSKRRKTSFRRRGDVKNVVTTFCVCWISGCGDTNEPQREKRTFGHVRPTKTQISLRIRAVWLESLLSAWRSVASMAIQNAPSEDSDQTAHMRSLIWIFARCTWSKVHFLTLRFIGNEATQKCGCF